MNTGIRRVSVFALKVAKRALTLALSLLLWKLWMVRDDLCDSSKGGADTKLSCVRLQAVGNEVRRWGGNPLTD